jgi:hypothetical protein
MRKKAEREQVRQGVSQTFRGHLRATHKTWNDYKNKATGLTYSDYSKDIKLYENYK